MDAGPIQILVIGFTRDDFTNKILPILRVLDETTYIKIIDILFGKKDIRGNIFAIAEDELTLKEAERFGSVAGTLIGLGLTQGERSEPSSPGDLAFAENDFGFNIEEIERVIEKIPNNSSFAIVLIEQCWTIEFKDNITKAGGKLLAQGQVSPLSLANVEAEIAATTGSPDKG
jgi:uncharacterized membrane protein